jgi:hypothetical protein
MIEVDKNGMFVVSFLKIVLLKIFCINLNGTISIGAFIYLISTILNPTLVSRLLILNI